MSFAGLVILVTIASALFACLGIWSGRQALGRRVGSGHHEVLGALLQTGGTLHAVLLAFLVVSVWQFYDSARANVADEASSITTLYRTTAAMHPDTGRPIRKLLRDYVGAVIDKEWPVQADHGGTSPDARKAGLAMYRVLGNEDAAVKQVWAAPDEAALSLLTQIQSDRNRRTLQATQSLPPIVWFAAIGSGLTVLSMSFLLIMERVRLQIFATTLMAITIGLLMCITLVLSRPFSGPMAIGPDAFVHCFDVFDAVDAMI